MVFSKQLLDGIRRGRIKCSIRFWTRPHVKVGGRYPLGDGRIVVDAITPIEIPDVTHALARESGFSSVQALLDIARHGSGENIYLIRFHYLRPGAWDVGPVPTRPAGRATNRSYRIRLPLPARCCSASAKAPRRRYRVRLPPAGPTRAAVAAASEQAVMRCRSRGEGSRIIDFIKVSVAEAKNTLPKLIRPSKTASP